MDSAGLALGLQFCAAIFMGADYFLDGDGRESINKLISKHAKVIKGRVDKDLAVHISETRRSGVKLVVSISFVLVAWLLSKVAPTVLPTSPSLWHVAVGVTMLFLAGGGLPWLVSYLVSHAVPSVFGAVVRTLAWFVERCPKGSVFGIGFLMLMCSFVVRYLALES